jgi:hypothetical protein
MPANKTNVIWCGPIDGYVKKPLTVEGEALAADIIPGNSVTLSAAGINNSANDGTTASRVLVAREIGEQFGADIFTAWDNGQNMIAVSPRSGENVYVNIVASAAAAVDTGLTDNGDGSWKVAGAGDVVKLFLAEAKGVTAAVQLFKAYKA